MSNLGTCCHILDAEDVVEVSPARGFPARVSPGSPFLQSSLWWPVEVALPGPVAKLQGTDQFITSKLLNLINQHTRVQSAKKPALHRNLCDQSASCQKPGLDMAGCFRVVVDWEKEGNHWD